MKRINTDTGEPESLESESVGVRKGKRGMIRLQRTMRFVAELKMFLSHLSSRLLALF